MQNQIEQVRNKDEENIKKKYKNFLLKFPLFPLFIRTGSRGWGMIGEKKGGLTWDFLAEETMIAVI